MVETSDVYKEQGNEAFKQGKYTDAISLYTKAISINPSVAAYFNNRAKCYKNLKDFKKMYLDSNEALELDSGYLKAYLTNGEALIELGKDDQDLKRIDKGIQRLRKAFSLCTGQEKRQFEQKITDQILLAQKIRYYKQEELTQADKAQLLHQLDLKLKQNTQHGSSWAKENNEVLDRFKSYLDPRKVMNEIPDYLLCRITDDLMTDPVVIQSGFTYERQAIKQHFSVNGPKDPMTLNEVDPSIMISNLFVKQATEDFINKNPWAFRHIPGENWRNIYL